MKELSPRTEPLPAFSTESAPVRFNESDPMDMLACELITQMYEGREAPLVAFTRDGYKTLIVPRTVTKIFPIPGAAS